MKIVKRQLRDIAGIAAYAISFFPSPLQPYLCFLSDSTDDWSRLVIAYEPVWAIGTGVTATP